MTNIANTFNLKSISDIPKLKKIFEAKNFSSLHIDAMTEVLSEISTFWLYEPNLNELQIMTSYSKWPEDVAYTMYHDYRNHKITVDLERLSNWVFTYREELVMSAFLFGYTNINAAKEYIVMSGFKDKIGEIL